MSKDNKKREFKIPKEVKNFLMPFKKWRKDNAFYESKKDARKAYYTEKLEWMGESVIPLLVSYGYRQEVIEIKNDLYEGLSDPEFVKVATKAVKKGDGFENQSLYAVLVQDMAEALAKQARVESAKTGETVVTDIDDMIELSKMVLEKKIKKAKKVGIDEATAFSVLSILPDTSILDIHNDNRCNKKFYFYRKLINCLYSLAKDKPLCVPVGEIIEFVFRKGDDFIPSFIVCAMLERKERYNSLNKTQQEVYDQLTTWAFSKLETYDKETITAALRLYYNWRKDDAANNRDSQRRYYVSSLPENEYPKTVACMNKIIASGDEHTKDFF